MGVLNDDQLILQYQKVALHQHDIDELSQPRVVLHQHQMDSFAGRLNGSL
jgi:hypothetical protein